MARVPLERDQDLSWETEFSSELQPSSDEKQRFNEQSEFDDRLRPEHRDTQWNDHTQWDVPERQPAEPRHTRQRHIQERYTEPSDRSSEALRYESPYVESRAGGTHTEQRRPRILPEDATVRMGRATRAVSLALLVVLAFGAGWALQRDFEGPTSSEQTPAAIETSTAPAPPLATPELEPSGPSRDNLVASRNPGDSIVADPPAAPEQREALNPALPAASPSQPSIEKPQPRSDAAPTRPRTSTPAQPATVGPRVNTESGSRTGSRPVASDRQTRSAPPEPRRGIAPPARPPSRSNPEPTPSTTRTVTPTSPGRATPPPAPVPPATAASAPPATTSPSASQTTTTPPPPRNAVEDAPAVGLPRAAVDEPALRPPTTPPAQPASAAPAATPPGAARPPAASPTSASAPAVVDDSGAIRDVLGRYRNAFNALDAKAAVQVWPTVNRQTLDRAFGQLEEQRLSFDRCTIAVKGALAEANCSGSALYVPRVGSRSAQTAQRQWSFSLRKAGEGAWLIHHVEAR